ncbi:hypothetical protein Tco_1221575 [Tanacetum coccineum]
MVGCTIASGPYMIYMQHDNDVRALNVVEFTHRIVGHQLRMQDDLDISEKEMTDKYCAKRNEMKKLEAELWNLKVKGMRCLLRHDSRSVMCVKTKTMQKLLKWQQTLMDKKISTFAENVKLENRGKL